MNKQLLLNAKKYNFLEKLNVGDFVDAIDQMRWKVAKIVSFKNVGHRHTIRLHFDGFPTHWDQDFDLPASTKLAPFRRFTLPYTGPTSPERSIHRPPASFNFETPYSILKRINKEQKQKLKAEWIIQNYRGEIFILMDTILSQSIKLKPEQYQQALKLFEAYIETGIHVLNYSLEKINEISKENVNDPNAIYINPVYALVSSLPQILFTFNSLVSLRERRIKFYTLMQSEISDVARKRIKNFLLSKDIIKICKNILDYQNPPYRGFPWSTKKEVLILLSGLEEPVQFPKIIDTREMSQALDVLGYLGSKQAFPEGTLQYIHIQLICTFIIGGNFEGKLRGLAELKKFCQGTLAVRKQILKQKILTPNLLNSLTDNATFNGQIFKRSLPVFQAAAKFDLLSESLLKRIISLHKDKHELQLKSFYCTLAQFGHILNQKKTLLFFDEIKQFPLSVDSINLIKQFTLDVLKYNPAFNRKIMDQQSGYGFGLVYLWNLVKQETPSEITTPAIEAFAALAGQYYYRQLLQKYLLECFNSIKQGRNVENSLRIIYCCLNKNKELTGMMEIIDRQVGLIDTVIRSLLDSSAISKNTIQNLFEFLQEVNQFAKKKLTVQHIKELWNFKQCQKGLLKFMRKYNTYSKTSEKPTDKILKKKLQTNEIKEIVNRIFMNKTLMDNYTKIDEEAYKTIDELLISYNHRQQNIEYNVKHTIRCMNHQALFGLELFLEIAMNCKDQEIANRSLKRYIEYYLRPFVYNNRMQTNKNDKIALWMTCVNKFTKYLQNSPKLYLAYSILFEEIKGRMKSINILDDTEVQLTVFAKVSHMKKTVTVCRGYSLWKLRQVINEAFKLNNTNFQMSITCRQQSTDMEKEQDFSVVFAEGSKDPSSISIIIKESKEPHPHYVAIQEFKMNFSVSYAQKIYESLSIIEDVNNQFLALKILLQIPTIKNLQARMSKLDIGKQFNWEQILDSECKARLCYQLNILNKVKSLGNPWISDFIKKGGVQHLQKIIRSRVTSKNTFHVKDFEILSKLVQFFNQTVQFYKTHSQNLPFNDNSVVQFLKITPKEKAANLPSEESYLTYFYLIFSTLKVILNYPNINAEKILTNKTTLQALQMLLFTPKKMPIQDRFPQNVTQIFTKGRKEEILLDFMQVSLPNFQMNSKLKYTCKLYFDLLVLMFDNNVADNKLYAAVLQFIQKIRYGSVEIFDEKQNQVNELICGWLRISKCLILKSITTKNTLKAIPETQQKFAQFLISNGLFGEGHRFESENARAQAFDILSILSCKKQIMDWIGKQLAPIMSKGPWRKQNEWFIKSFNKREKDTKVGLKNLAATCYINSLLQQLFYIKQFRQPLLSIDASSIETQQNIAYEIQKIFAYLKYTNKQIYSTQTLCENFISQGQPIDPRMQMDVDEFFHTLMDKIEFNLKKIKKEDIINDVFQGEYSNLIVGQECQHKSERVENFMSMRLEIKNKSSLTQALAQFIKGEVLEGQNAYFCQKCDKKIKAMKRVCVKTLPDVLILTLKRFEFDFDRMEKFKLNSFCQFEQNLDMEPYMRQSLYENEQKLDKQSYKFKLKGVIIHYGISEAGHYTSYIKMDNGEWKYFDDDKISNFDVKELGKESFGGIDDNPYSDNSQKIKNAYVLIYERSNKKQIGTITINPQIKAEVDAENLNNQQVKILFDAALQQFFDTNYLSFGKTYLLYVHLVTLRSYMRQKYLKKCYQNCISLFQSSAGIGEWYLEQFSQSLIKQFLIYGHNEASYFVASLLCYCVNKYFNADFIKRCMKCLDKKNMMALNKVFQIASQNPNYFKVLSQYSFHERVFKIIKEDKCSPAPSLAKIQNSRSQFGEPKPDFFSKKDLRNPIELLRSIELLKFKTISFEDFKFLYSQAKRLSTQVTFAKFFTSKLKDEEQFSLILNNFLYLFLTKHEFKLQDEYLFRLALIMIAKYCQIKDQLTRRRIQKLAELYFVAIRESLQGYKPMRMLLEGLFSLCFSNEIFHEEIVNYFNLKDNKKYIKAVREWMKESQRFLIDIKNERLGYWRKPGRTSYILLQRVENDKKVKPDTYLSLFNSMLQKHKIDFSDLYSPIIKVGEVVSLNELEQYEFEVVSKFGLLLELKDSEGNIKFVLEDDVFPLRCI